MTQSKSNTFRSKCGAMVLLAAAMMSLCLSCRAWAETLYTDLEDIPNPTFEELLATVIPDGETFGGPIYGSTIDVVNELLELGSYGNRPIQNNINIHTLCNSVIGRSNFPKWTRWYQEDGQTQIFRLFTGERNTRNDRPDAARVEAFSAFKWGPGKGPWNEWTGRYTIVKPHGCAIFQAKNNINDWGIMLNMNDAGDITLNHRRHQDDVVIATNMTGKSFDIRVLDNGYDYMVWLNGEHVGTGYYDRPEGTTSFRWGMYDGTIQHDALLFVSGATVRANVDPNEPYIPQEMSIHYPLDGDAQDAGPDHYDGTLVGGGFVPSLVEHDQGLGLDGVDDYVDVPGCKGVIGPVSRTCCAWVKTDRDTGYQDIVGWGSSSGSGQRWLVTIRPEGPVQVAVIDGYRYGTTAVNDGRWHHVAVVLDSDGSPETDDIQIYIDGVEESNYTTLSIPIDTVAGQNVQIGLYSDAYSRYFAGQIDDVRIYSSALTQEEIQALAAISRPPVDIVPNDAIDLADVSALAGYWLSGDCFSSDLCAGRDLNADQAVNLEDVSILAEVWLSSLVVPRVEDVESYAVSTIMDGQVSGGPLGGLWDTYNEDPYHALRAGEVVADADDAANQVIRIQNAHNGYRSLSVSQLNDPIETDETGILFFRFMYAEDGLTGELEFHAGIHAFGPTDNDPLTLDNGNDLGNFIAGFSAANTSATTFDIRSLDGTTVWLTGLDRYVWYNMWIVADHATDTFDLYVSPADGAAGKAEFPMGEPVVRDVTFYTTPTAPLSGGLWLVGQSMVGRGASVRLDEIAWSANLPSWLIEAVQ